MSLKSEGIMEKISLDNEKMKKVIGFIINFQLPVLITATGCDISFEEPLKIIDFEIHPRLTEEYSEKMVIKLNNKTRFNLKSFTDKFEMKIEYSENKEFTNFVDIKISNIKDKNNSVDFPVVISVAFNKGTEFATEVLKLLEIARS